MEAKDNDHKSAVESYNPFVLQQTDLGDIKHQVVHCCPQSSAFTACMLILCSKLETADKEDYNLSQDLLEPYVLTLLMYSTYRIQQLVTHPVQLFMRIFCVGAIITYLSVSLNCMAAVVQYFPLMVDTFHFQTHTFTYYIRTKD